MVNKKNDEHNSPKHHRCLTFFTHFLLIFLFKSKSETRSKRKLGGSCRARKHHTDMKIMVDMIALINEKNTIKSVT